MNKRGLPVLIVTALLLLAAGALVLRGDGEEQPTLTSSQVPTVLNAVPTAPEFSGSPLFVTNRDHLSICVDGAGGFNISDTEVEAVQAALDSSLASVPDAPGAYSQPTVAVGCPAPPAALVDPAVKPANRGVYLGVMVDVPSNHLLFVYFMDNDAYTTSFGSAPFSKASAEYICTFDDCVGVTLSVYFPQPAGSDVLREGLLDILSLLPRPPEPTIDWQACDRGEEPGLGISCDDYPDYKRDLELEQATP